MPSVFSTGEKYDVSPIITNLSAECNPFHYHGQAALQMVTMFFDRPDGSLKV